MTQEIYQALHSLEMIIMMMADKEDKRHGQWLNGYWIGPSECKEIATALKQASQWLGVEPDYRTKLITKLEAKATSEEETRQAWQSLGDAYQEAMEEING